MHFASMAAPLCLLLAAVPAQKVPRQPYVRYQTVDRFDRSIDYYLSEAGPESAQKLPLIVYIQGSGPKSHFVRDADGRVRGATGHSSLADVVQGKARLLIVEKPGIAPFEDPTVPGGPATFRQEHTLDRWVEALRAALDAAVKAMSADRILVIGHSEGGLVAARLARVDPRITHAAILAGGGPTQLFDLIQLARKGDFFKGVSEQPEVRVQYVLDQWKAILKEPDSADKLFLGHAFRRWSSFLATSPIEELLGTKAKLFVGQGGQDTAVDPALADALVAQLLSKGRAATYARIEAADHSLRS